MKRQVITILCALSTFIFIWGTVSAQESEISKEISTLLSKADASKLASHFNSTIDLTLPGQEGTFSKKQAEQILKMFFNNNPVKNFTLNHSGNSNNGSLYLIGSYQTTSEKKFRVYLLIKKQNNVDLIQQLQFEEE